MGYSPCSQLQRTGHNSVLGFPGGSDSLPAVWETQVLSLGQDDPLEKEMVTHSNILAWRIPWTEEPGKLQSTGPQRDTTEYAHTNSAYGLGFKSKHLTLTATL